MWLRVLFLIADDQYVKLCFPDLKGSWFVSLRNSMVPVDWKLWSPMWRFVYFTVAIWCIWHCFGLKWIQPKEFSIFRLTWISQSQNRKKLFAFTTVYVAISRAKIALIFNQSWIRLCVCLLFTSWMVIYWIHCGNFKTVKIRILNVPRYLREFSLDRWSFVNLFIFSTFSSLNWQMTTARRSTNSSPNTWWPTWSLGLIQWWSMTSWR